MGEVFEGRDLSEAVFWGIDLQRSRFRDINFTGASMHGVWLVDVSIDGLVDRVVINGVDVTDFVNANDPWQPLRGMLRPGDRDGLLAALDETDRMWRATIDQARALADEQRHASVNGEWSFVQTLRHLVFATDKWFTHPVTGGTFHPIGLTNTGSADFPFPGVDPDAAPTFDDAVDTFAGRMRLVRDHVDGAGETELQRDVEVLENGTTPVIECVYVVLEEAFEHLRYARRDLASFS